MDQWSLIAIVNLNMWIIYSIEKPLFYFCFFQEFSYQVQTYTKSQYTVMERATRTIVITVNIKGCKLTLDKTGDHQTLTCEQTNTNIVHEQLKKTKAKIIFIKHAVK